MQPVFAAHVELVPTEEVDAVGAVDRIADWARERFGVAIEPWQSLERTLVARPAGHVET